MALGLSAAGFKHDLVVEFDAAAVATLQDNNVSSEWPLHDGDVRDADFSTIPAGIDLLAAGVPCQPFSQGGVHAGPADTRNMFPETFAAIRALRPRAVLIENVRGLARTRFAPFVDYVVDHLQVPHCAIRADEPWPAHHTRVKAALAAKLPDDERYVVEWRLVCAADYGVPQRRIRLIMVAIRADLAGRWKWPDPTHAMDSLLREKLDGYYWLERGIPQPADPWPRNRLKRVQRLRRPLERAAWRTLRDAIGDLPGPAAEEYEAWLPGHVFWPGARLYRGHRGSALDDASKTIKAGVHGVAGGEHIVHLDDGTFRYLTVRECMRIQDLPDSMIIDAPRSGAMRQIGNAVPPLLAEVFGRSIRQAVCEPQTVPRELYVQRQDEAAGGYLWRQIEIDGRRMSASVRLQRGYAYLYFNRAAGNPVYLGKVTATTPEEQLRQGWEIAHRDHPALFLAAKPALERA